MKTIQVFDPALCCSTGVCGVDVDQALVSFSADLDWAKQNGAKIERFNLAQQPMAFADNAVVKSFLQRSGPEALPLEPTPSPEAPATTAEPGAAESGPAQATDAPPPEPAPDKAPARPVFGRRGVR